MNGLSSNILSRPEAILQAQQFSKRLWQDSDKLIRDTEALKRQGITPQRIAMYLATEHPSIKLVGVLLQLPPDKRVPVLTGDGLSFRVVSSPLRMAWTAQQIPEPPSPLISTAVNYVPPPYVLPIA